MYKYNFTGISNALMPRICLRIFFLFMLAAPDGINAQPVYPYWDQYNRHFNVYDDGQLKNIEILKPLSFKSGSNLCAYITEVYDFKVFVNGKSKLLSKFRPTNYECSESMVAWSSSTSTFVYYDGQTRKLCDMCSGFRLNDSIVQFVDRYGFFSVFNKNKVRRLDIMTTDNFTLGRNLIAYVDRNLMLKVWCNDTAVALEYFSDSLKYACGLNTVGFIDNIGRLRVFYRDRVYTLDKLRPHGFQVGDDMVAWVDQNKNLRVFHKGNVFLLENYEPGVYNIIDGVMYYRSPDNQFKVFEDGKARVLETYFPTQFSGRNKTLVYLDFRNRLKAYSDGKTYDVSEDIVTSFTVYNDLIVYYSNAKSLTFWRRGERIEVQLN
jgi:hypothetical protein